MLNRTTKEKILFCAIELFGKYSFSSVSMRQIAQEVGIKGGSIYNHFDSKQAILDSIITYLEQFLFHYRPSADEILLRLQTETPTQILSRFTTFYEHRSDPLLTAIYRLLLQEQYSCEEIRAIADDYFTVQPASNISHALEVLMEVGAIPACDSRLIAELWSRTHFIYGIQATHDINLVHYGEYVAMGDFFIQATIRGVKPLPGSRLHLEWDLDKEFLAQADTDAPPSTKQLIVLKALELFSEKGYSTVSIREIAHAVGIKGGSIYNHFDSKSDIMKEITERVLDSYMQHSRSHPVFQAALKAKDATQVALTLSSSYPPVKQDLVYRVYRVLFREQYRSEDIRDFLLGTITRDITAITQLLEEIAQEGRIPPCDSRRIAIAYAHAMCSCTIEATLFPQRMEQLNHLRFRMVSYLTSLVLHGYQGEEEQAALSEIALI